MSLIEPVVEFFASMGWEANKLEKVPVLTGGLQLPNGEVDIYIHAHEDRRRLLVYARPKGLEVPREEMRLIAEYLTRANYGLPLGNFELDMLDGEINFKTSVELANCELTPEMVRPLVLTGVETLNHYLPGLQQVLAGEATPAQAIAAIEANAGR